MKRLLLLSFLVLGFFTFQEDEYLIEIGQIDVSQLPIVTLYINVTDDKGNPVTTLLEDDFTVREDGQTVKIKQFAGIGDNRPVDIVFVFDTTGSMENEIAGAIDSCAAFAEELEEQGRDYRLGLITYGDNIRGVYNTDQSLTSSISEYKSWLTTLEAEGGDDSPENTLGALKAATQMRFREDSQALFILITDDEIHYYGDPTDGGYSFNDPDLTYANTLALLSEPRPISVFPVAVSWVAEYHQLAKDTNGRFYDLEAGDAFTDIIDEIGAVIATQYKISYTTPRPDFDGTRRNISVEVGGSNTDIGYLEPHLINLKSNILVGVSCLAPLMLALIIPFAIILFMHKKATPLPGSEDSNSPQAPASPYAQHTPSSGTPSADTVCSICGSPLKSGAKFCNHCGSPAQPDEMRRCSQCGTSHKPHAKFCPICGNKLN